jgi:hypothetical protein
MKIYRSEVLEMKRFKKPKKQNLSRIERELLKKSSSILNKKLEEEAERLSENIYPVILLACKDECRLTMEQVNKLDKRIERYLRYIGEGLVGLDDIKASLQEKLQV